ncbi:MAG TPA: lysophospholipid acyltransferase family protein [Marmoricola sp.]|jgi:1-acyl-sn-glycerol-3-phosphate acyltransferase|nr:lysophospholipid acyltransferase family protein [Marmoricola sp.]
MADADIIPLGTRGRPGRGSGSGRPSSSSRSLAGAAGSHGAGTGAGKAAPKKGAAKKAAQKKAAPKKAADKKAAPKKAADKKAADKKSAQKAAPEPTRSKPAAPQRPPRDAAPAGPREAARRSTLAAGPPPTPTDGIPVIDWLAAFTGASKELFGDDWEPRLAEFLAFLRRRLTGDYAIDEYGFDPEITQRFFMSAIRPIARKWFRIEVRGVENIPADGGALVVSNHSGTIPVDGLMTMVSIHDHAHRFLRPLGADLVFKLPVIGELARKGGATLACNEDAERMLRGGELVGVWPEGFKGIGKPYSERYKLQRFGRGGFVSAAIRTGVPIVPTSVVGAEEIYPLVGNIPSLARLLGLPYIPITPLFPLLGPLGLVPLPSKWLIEFGEPIRTDEYDASGADDPMLVFNVTDQVRETIQQTLYTLLVQRESVFG